MTTHNGAAQGHGVTRGKLILIGVLGAIFVAVVYWNYFRDTGESAAPSETREPGKGNSEQAAPSTRRESRDRAETTARQENDATRDEEEAGAAVAQPWPEFELAQVITTDPFALPSKFPQPPPQVVEVDPEPSEDELEKARLQELRAQQAAFLEKYLPQGAELILLSDGEYVAKMGELKLRVGDVIEGFRVIAISFERGVELELLEGVDSL